MEGGGMFMSRPGPKQVNTILLLDKSLDSEP